jgi:DNA-binding FadR family transcriptional regulator
MTFQKIEPKKKSQMATEMLLDVIKTKQFKPGDKLPPERIMAAEMGVSRNTLREAVAALQLLGILEVRHSQGNFVVNLNETENRNSILENIFATNDDPFTTIDARLAFEPGVAAMACELATDQDLKTIESDLQNVVSAIKRNDLNDYSLADYNFHLNIAQCTHNQIIIQTIQCIIRTLTQPLWRSMKQGIAATDAIRSVRITEHELIYHALLTRDAAQAQEHVRRHLKHSKERLHFEIENADVDTPPSTAEPIC